MRKSPLIEELEDRRLLAAQLTVGPNNMYFNAVVGSSQTYTLRINNTGDKRVTISQIKFVGDNAGKFTVTDFPSGGRSLGVGGQVNYTIKYTPGSSYKSAFDTATLRVFSNVPSKNGFSNVVPIRAMVTKGTGGSLEPSLQKIFNLYNLPIDSGETDAENYLFPSTPSSTSDEITAQSFVKAGTGNVTITPLAVFTNSSTPALRMGIYTPGDADSGKYLWYVPSDTSQSVNPYFYGQTKFDPGSAEFGVLSQYPAFYNTTTNGTTKIGNGTKRNVYSENALNGEWSTSSTYNHFRVYPYVNSNKQVVPNAYVVAEEEYSATNVADNNDVVFIITNVKIAGNTPTLSVENIVGYPSNDAVVFNKVQIPDANAGNLTRTTNTVNIRNTGLSPLVVNIGLSGADFSITSGGGNNITIAPGGKQVVKLSFNATSGTGIHTGSLNITSNDPNNATVAVNLIGVWQEASEYTPNTHNVSDEPSAQTLVNKVFGYTTSIPTTSQFENTIKSNVVATGDQISAEYFIAADSGSDAQVNVTELATFHNVTYLASDGTNKPTNSFMGWYTKGSPTSSYKQVLVDKADTGQMVLPTSNVSGATVTYGTFHPGTDTQFGFVVEQNTTAGTGEYSDHTLNPIVDSNGNVTGTGQFLRFYVAKDANGVVIPNTYIMLHDYNRSTTNYDFNDNIYLISNVIPVGQVKSAPTATAFKDSTNGTYLYWTSPTDGPKITGFNVYRSTSVDGVYTLLTNTPLNARPSMGLHDDSATSTSPYYYAIESVGQNGAKSARVIVKA